MWKFSKKRLLILVSFLIIISGSTLLWFGFQPQQTPDPVTSVTTLSEPEEIQSATSSATQGVEGERAQVTKVVDGDTIQVLTGGEQKTVRLIGIDTPETVDPRRPIGCFGKEASNEAKSLLSGKEVILQKDVSDTDKYQRLLRYVYLPLEGGQSLFINDYLVREGFAKVLTYLPDVKFNEKFREAEREAKENNKGLWGRCI